MSRELGVGSFINRSQLSDTGCFGKLLKVKQAQLQHPEDGGGLKWRGLVMEVQGPQRPHLQGAIGSPGAESQALSPRGGPASSRGSPLTAALALETIAALVAGKTQAIPQRGPAVEPSVRGRKQNKTNQTYLIMAGAAADIAASSRGWSFEGVHVKSISFKP